MAHVALILKNHTNPAYAGAVFGARAAAARFGLEIRFSAPQVPDDIAEQSALLAAAIAARPAAIVMIPAHETRLAESLARIRRAGIPFVTLVGEPEDGPQICHVGSDDEALARDVADRLLSLLPRGSRVAIMDGHPDSITTPKRHRGFLAAIEAHAGLELVGCVVGWFQREPARQAASELLAHEPRLDALLVANDLMAMGVLDALQETGRRVQMVSVNGTPDAVAAIREGRLVASASFNTLGFGSLAAEAAARHLRGEPVPRRIFLPAEIIDAANCARWDLPYEQRPLPAWEATVAAHWQG